MNALGEREPCTVVAYHRGYGVDGSLEIDIRPPELVDNIVIAAGRSTMNAGSGDTTWVRATCYLNPERTQIAPRGTLVFFEVENGMGTFSSSQVVVGDAGVATTSFRVSPQVGRAVIRASVFNETEEGNVTIRSNDVQIDMVPGAAASIFIQISPSVLRIDEAGEQSFILATVIDSFGNPVRNGSVQVQFTTTLGHIDPRIALTDSGRAVAFLHPGFEAGVAEVIASAGNIHSLPRNISFIAGGGSSMELSAHPQQIQVAGTGGVSTSTLRATVFDSHGNLVEVPTRVVFKLLTNDEPPLSCNINDNDPYDSDTVLTSNGVATVTLNSGTKSGPQLIRAYTLNAEGEPSGVQASFSNVVVWSGPPTDISVDVNDNAVDAGGGAWTIELSALVQDAYRNAAPDSIPVSFSLFEENIGIVSNGFTGNRGINGRPTPGVAYATLTYNSRNTFTDATIRAHCRTLQVDSVGSEIVHTLPLQRGELELHTDPDNWMFDRDERDEMCDIRVWAILRDGHGVLINNAPILFGSNRGRYWYDTRAGDQVDFEQYAPNPARRHTGQLNDGANPNERGNDDDRDGHTVVWLRGIMDDFFLDPFTLEVLLQLEARVEGNDDVFSNPQFVTLTRH